MGSRVLERNNFALKSRNSNTYEDLRVRYHNIMESNYV